MNLLSGIKVIELSHMVMGPSVGLILGDLGADVIKIEPLDGDKTRELTGSGAGYFPMFNRNKKSLCLDLKTDDGKRILKRLLGDADVMTENFRAGALDKLGFGYEAVKAINPQIIYQSCKGFLSGPYEKRAALDEVAQMMGGLAYMTGPTGRPLRAGASVIDITGGMFGVIGILSALLKRQSGGENTGALVTSALFETTAFLVGQHMAQFAVTGKPAAPMPERISAWAVYDVFNAKDGQIFVGVVSDSQWVAFCDAFNLKDWVDDASLRENAKRVDKRDVILPRLKTLFAEMSRDQLSLKLGEAGLPYAPIQKPDDLLSDQHLMHNGLLDVTLTNGNTAQLPKLPLEIDGQRSVVSHDLPQPGIDTDTVLSKAGFSENDIAKFRRDGIVA